MRPTLLRASRALVLLVPAAALVATRVASAAETDLEHTTGTRSTFVHRLPLLNTEGEPIRPDDPIVLPFSFRTSCTQCHDYGEVRGGRHFNYMDPLVPPGRPGQPWFVTDRATGTQIPVSHRPWPNTYRPGDLGMTPGQFCRRFGRHLPGGGAGEATDAPDPAARWLVSGKLEINCQACHSGNPQYDHVAWFLQISAENFMWAPAATTDLATVTGAAAGMPHYYDPYMGPEDERQARTAPTIVYDASKFDAKGQVFFDIPNRPPDTRCFYCHTNVEVGPDAPEPWEADADVHLAAGLHCATCHRNGLDHLTVRGYEGEAERENRPDLPTLTCRGCHLGDESAAAGAGAAGGRLGAPVPAHRGLPAHHIEKLSCTACHSGLRPQATTRRTQTSRGHALEFQGPHRAPDALPWIHEPVFLRDARGVIVPHRAVWPAFWCTVEEDGAVKPLAPETVLEDARDAFDDAATAREDGRLSDARILAVLAALRETGHGPEVGYVTGGKMHRAESRGTLTASAHPAGALVGWPIGHDVRPVPESLGAGGCTDCHGTGAPIYFGEVEVPSLTEGADETRPMHAMRGESETELRAWALSYTFRPYFKITGYAAMIVMGAVLAWYGLRAVGAVSRWFAARAARGEGDEA